MRFHCTLTGPGQKGTLVDCPLDAPQGDITKTTGAFTTGTLQPNRAAYKLVVQAYVPAVVVAGKTTVAEVDGTTAAYSWRVFSVTRLDNYSPATGASFNKPLGTTTEQRRNLTRMIRTINSIPGYHQATGDDPAPCPTTPALVPATIRVSMYSMTDRAFARRARAAHRRCVQRPDPDEQPPQRPTRTRPGAPLSSGWAGRARRGCPTQLRPPVLATAAAARRAAHQDVPVRLHGPRPAAGRNRIENTVLVGSSNITSNASKVQWNDLYTIRGNAAVHRDYLEMFNRMKPAGRAPAGLLRSRRGSSVTIFWPQGSATDP